MCGIVGYIGHREALPILINGLKRLEYRGYDSAGVALYQNREVEVIKTTGKVADLEDILPWDSRSGVGIGHTRWATHGIPNDVNAHPHTSSYQDLTIVHNGIIENYHVLSEELKSKGYSFKSETDTEVLVTFISDVWKHHEGSLEEAVRLALSRVVGAYGIVLMTPADPGKLIAVRKGSPLVLGIGENENFVGSDASPFIEYTKEVVYLNDGDIAVIEPGEVSILDNQNISQTPYIQTLDIELQEIEKGGFDHFMLKEIYEQPQAVRNCMRGRLDIRGHKLRLGGISEHAKHLYRAERIIITACGTSFYSGLVAEYFLEELCRIPVEVEYASEFRYRNPIIRDGDTVIAISQSGETADTLTAVKLAKSMGAKVFGICNVVASSIARETDAGIYTHAGPEIGVASTKAFTAQIIVLAMMALKIARYKGTIQMEEFGQHLHELNGIPDKIDQTLKLDHQIREIASVYKNSANFLYLGRGYNYPVAMEGALKLKEISYIHAEGYPAAEMKHGPIALIDENMPVVVIATRDQAYEKIISNIQEIKSRKGKVIAIVTEGDNEVSGMVDHVISIPAVSEVFGAMVTVIPLQLLAYHIGVMRGLNVDQPRNLAKSVTVE